MSDLELLRSWIKNGIKLKFEEFSKLDPRDPDHQKDAVFITGKIEAFQAVLTDIEAIERRNPV